MFHNSNSFNYYTIFVPFFLSLSFFYISRLPSCLFYLALVGERQVCGSFSICCKCLEQTIVVRVLN